MLLNIGEKTVIEQCISGFYDYCTKIIVVTGKYHQDMQGCLKKYDKIRIVHNNDYQQGMFSSVKVGVSIVESERFFLTPGDYPLLQSTTICRMINTPGSFLSPVYKGVQGHPILLDKHFIPVILNSTDINLRDCLKKSALSRQEIYVDDIGVTGDIDTIEEYKAVVERYNRIETKMMDSDF